MDSKRADWVRGEAPVDLVGQKDVCEDGTLVEQKGVLFGIEDGHPDDVRGQKIRGKLNPPKFHVHGPGQDLGQGGFAGAGIILQQNMAPRRQRRR